jgi:hypothetical protein
VGLLLLLPPTSCHHVVLLHCCIALVDEPAQKVYDIESVYTKVSLELRLLSCMSLGAPMRTGFASGCVVVMMYPQLNVAGADSNRRLKCFKHVKRPLQEIVCVACQARAGLARGSFHSCGGRAKAHSASVA